MSRPAAIDYLRTPPGAPWQWDENGRVLAWRDGTTVMFREELEVIVERLAPRGLPDFPALVLLLAACRGKVPEIASSVEARAVGQHELVHVLQKRRSQLAVDELKSLAQLPAELIARAAGKALLAEAVFEHGGRLAADQTTKVVQGLPAAWGEAELNSPPADVAGFDFWHVLQIVIAGMRRHSAESLMRRLRTGLDDLPVAAPEVELPREERSRRLIETLAADENHAGLAQIVRDLMAALRLPRTLARADETAAEGVSDIGNRGPLDRLVLSELAHDDLTLATRVALNEALYLRREPPAQRPERSLAVLLDSGVRMWGVPRVLGVAAALALVSRHPSGCPALVWRAQSRKLVPVDLLAKASLEAHLEVLVAEAHPGNALPAFGAALAEQPESDAVIVTQRDVLGDAGFRAELARMEFDRGFLVVIARDGLVQLHSLPWGEPRPLAEARVDVAKLFPRRKSRPAAVPLVDAELAGDFPAIFRERPFPLLLPVNAKMELAVHAGAGGLCVTGDQRLLRWEKHGQGARQLATDLPAGRTCALLSAEGGEVVVVKGRGGDGRMSVVVSLGDGREPRIARFTGPHHPLAASIDRHVVLIVLHTRVVVVAISTAEVLAETAMPAGLRWINGPYFTGPEGLCFVAWDGVAARWDSLAVGRQAEARDVLTLFDRDGIGAWVVLNDGRLLSPTGSEALNAGFRLDQARVTHGGRRVAIRKLGRDEWHVMDLEAKRVWPARDATVAIAALPIQLPQRNLQAKFFSVWAAPGEPLRLRKNAGKGGKWLEIFLKAGGSLQLVESAVTDEALRGEARAFVALTTPHRLGCRLQTASWPGGSRVWLDSRGLLHFRSASSGVPEFTLALCYQAALAGWCADGARCGPVFFHGEDDRVADDPKRFQQLLGEFCAHVC